MLHISYLCLFCVVHCIISLVPIDACQKIVLVLLVLKWHFFKQQLTSPWSKKRHGWAAVLLPPSLSSFPTRERIQDNSPAHVWQLCSALRCSASKSGKLECSHIWTTPGDRCKRPITVGAQQPAAVSCRALVCDHKASGQLQSLLPKGERCSLVYQHVYLCPLQLDDSQSSDSSSNRNNSSSRANYESLVPIVCLEPRRWRQGIHPTFFPTTLFHSCFSPVHNAPVINTNKAISTEWFAIWNEAGCWKVNDIFVPIKSAENDCR